MSLGLHDTSEYDGGPFGPEVPSEVLFASKLFSASADATMIIPASELNSLISLCFQYVSTKKFSRLRYLSLKRGVLQLWEDSQLMAQLNLSKGDFDRLFAGLLKIVQAISRNSRLYSERWSLGQLKSDVVKHARLSDDLTDLLFAQFIDAQTEKPKYPIINTWAATGPRLVSMRWRLDVIISDRSLAKIMEPVIRMELHLSDGGVGPKRTVSFEVRLGAFHRLRFMTACLLREMAQLEGRIGGCE